MEAPQIIKDEAKELINMYGDQIIHIGQYDNREVYQFIFPGESTTGFPFVYLVNNNEAVEKVTGPEALDILHIIRTTQNTVINI